MTAVYYFDPVITFFCSNKIQTDNPAEKVWKDMGTGHLSIKCKEGAQKATKASRPTIVVRNDVCSVLLILLQKVICWLVAIMTFLMIIVALKWSDRLIFLYVFGKGREAHDSLEYFH